MLYNRCFRPPFSQALVLCRPCNPSWFYKSPSVCFVLPLWVLPNTLCVLPTPPLLGFTKSPRWVLPNPLWVLPSPSGFHVLVFPAPLWVSSNPLLGFTDPPFGFYPTPSEFSKPPLGFTRPPPGFTAPSGLYNPPLGFTKPPSGCYPTPFGFCQIVCSRVFLALFL